MCINVYNLGKGFPNGGRGRAHILAHLALSPIFSKMQKTTGTFREGILSLMGIENIQASAESLTACFRFCCRWLFPLPPIFEDRCFAKWCVSVFNVGSL